MTIIPYISPAISMLYVWFATAQAWNDKPLPPAMGVAACITWLMCEIQVLHLRGLL